MKEFINEILSSPFGLILETIIGIAILVLIILSKTKFGKKLLLELAAKIAANKSEVDTKVKELNNTKDELTKSYEENTKAVEKRLAEKDKQFNQLEKFLLNALKSINNVNVKKAVEDYEKLKDKYLNDEYEKIGYNGEKE